MTVRFIPELAGITPYQPGLPVEGTREEIESLLDKLACLELDPGEPGAGGRP